MASRKELKEQRRREREEAERRAEQDERRRRRLRIYAAVAVVVVLGGGLGVFALAGGFESDPMDAFAARPDGAEERVRRAGVTAGTDHFHPTVRVVVNGEPVPIPATIFEGPGGRPLTPMHFHSGDETIHAEGVEEGTLTLGQFMTIWGVPLSPTRLGDYRASGQRKVRVLVRPKGGDRFTETRDLTGLQLRDGDEVYVTYGTAEESPIVL